MPTKNLPDHCRRTLRLTGLIFPHQSHDMWHEGCSGTVQFSHEMCMGFWQISMWKLFSVAMRRANPYRIFTPPTKAPPIPTIRHAFPIPTAAVYQYTLYPSVAESALLLLALALLLVLGRQVWRALWGMLPWSHTWWWSLTRWKTPSPSTRRPSEPRRWRRSTWRSTTARDRWRMPTSSSGTATSSWWRRPPSSAPGKLKSIIMCRVKPWRITVSPLEHGIFKLLHISLLRRYVQTRFESHEFRR